MIDSRHVTDILDVKSCRGADCDSDYYMVNVKYRQGVSAIGKLSSQRIIEYNVENLNQGTSAKEYRNKLEELLEMSPNTEDQQVEATWEDIKQVICKAADNMIYYTGCPRRNGQNFGRVFLMLNYTDITQNTYIQS